MKSMSTEVIGMDNISLKREERIRRRAHQLYRLRGETPGSALDDWLRAEAEIREQQDRAIDEAEEESFPASDSQAL
jgi:hypothetical protein